MTNCAATSQLPTLYLILISIVAWSLALALAIGLAVSLVRRRRARHQLALRGAELSVLIERGEIDRDDIYAILAFLGGVDETE